MKSLTAVLTGLSGLLLLSLYENVQSQAQFLTYENPDYDISIQYPNDWTPSEDNLLRHQVVIFSAPEIEEKESSVSTIIYIPADCSGSSTIIFSKYDNESICQAISKRDLFISQ